MQEMEYNMLNTITPDQDGVSLQDNEEVMDYYFAVM